MSLDSLVALATSHLLLHLGALNRALEAGIERQKIASSQLSRPDLPALCLTDEHVKTLLDQIRMNQIRMNQACTEQNSDASWCAAQFSPDELRTEQDLRERCAAISEDLPLDRLSDALHLTAFEKECVLLCAAPELDRSYERIYAFIHDDLNRRLPSLELLISLTSSGLDDRLSRRRVLSSASRLRRTGILLTTGDAPTDLRQEFRLAPAVFEYLTGSGPDVSRLCHDPAEVAAPASAEAPPQISEHKFAHLVQALADGSVCTVGIWGPDQSGPQEWVIALAGALKRPLRQITLDRDLDRNGKDAAPMLRDQFTIASSLAAILWFDTDTWADAHQEKLNYTLANALSFAPVPLLLSGRHPWRPLSLLRKGGYADLELEVPTNQTHAALWRKNFPDLDPDEVGQWASRYRLSPAEVRSVSDLARTQARLAGNGQPDPVKNHIADACAIITLRSANRFSTIVRPHRRPEDLVLPANLHQQIMEVARFFDLRPRVNDEWGYGEFAGTHGMKTLFTGDPGTGKTLAAEVIAGAVGLSLCKVDLARVVSKWVGETERNLESAFTAAEDSHSILFFDEAEALFGKRAEVQHGTDRYANLEVSYLLQRLEASRGLVILASNVKDQIDSAFIRRFQVVVHFPRPAFSERRRIWQRAFPGAAPVDQDLNLDTLAQLDMTGAAIMNAARNAALIAANSGAQMITAAHVVYATARQFRREARVLTPTDLGPYGALLQEVS
jgi:AAA+ superfamily predicted ATPase